jgi:hypothetical protein
VVLSNEFALASRENEGPAVRDGSFAPVCNLQDAPWLIPKRCLAGRRVRKIVYSDLRLASPKYTIARATNTTAPTIKIEIVTPLKSIAAAFNGPTINSAGQGRSQLSLNEGNINDNESDYHSKQAESQHIAHVVAGNACPSTHSAHFVSASPSIRFFVFRRSFIRHNSPPRKRRPRTTARAPCPFLRFRAFRPSFRASGKFAG